MTDELDVEAAETIEADQIGLEFAPQPRDSVVTMEIDGELLLVDRETGYLNLLDPVGSVVWNCLDGSATLSELADDFADAFGAPLDVVRQDVLEMVRTVGRVGLLTGVAPMRATPTTPTGVDVGEVLEPFAAPDLDGVTIDLAALRGRQVLLVNWSPRCGYCAKIAPDLAEVQPSLAEQGVSLVLLTSGESGENRELLETHGLVATTLLRDEAGEEYEDPFPSMGTPVAYLLDTEGRVAEPLAYGANEVPTLARRVAGLEPVREEPAAGHDHADGEDEDDHGHDHGEPAARSDGPKYLPASAGVCNPGAGSAKNPRVWAKTSAYQVGEYHIGIRADSLATDEVLGRVFAAQRLPDDVEAPDNFSVVLGDGGARGGTRGLNLLLWTNTTVVRSRSPKRVLRALAGYLSSVLPPDGEDGLIRTTNVGALVGDTAILLPSVVTQWLEQVQPRLTRLGVRLVDGPSSIIDPDRLELVVPEHRVRVDELALARLKEPAPSRSELPPVAPGRYPLRAWTLWETGEAEGRLTRGRAVAVSLPTVISDETALDGLLPQLVSLLDRISPVPLVFGTAEELTDSLKERLPALR